MNSSSKFEKPIGKCGFPVINVRDDGEITNLLSRKLQQIDSVFGSELIPLDFSNDLVVRSRREAAVLVKDKHAPPPPPPLLQEDLHAGEGGTDLEATT